MKAPCCLLGAAALPRPPEGKSARGSVSFRCRNKTSSSTLLRRDTRLIMWIMIMLMTNIISVSAEPVASGTRAECPIRTDALDIESRSYVASQVVEATVQHIKLVGGSGGDRVWGGNGGGFGDGGGDVRRKIRHVGSKGMDGVEAKLIPGQPYIVTVFVSRVLKRYRGPSRVKKRSTLNFTLRYPSAPSAPPSTSSFDSDMESDLDNNKCLVSASLLPGRKYILFLSDGTCGAGGCHAGEDSEGDGGGMHEGRHRSGGGGGVRGHPPDPPPSSSSRSDPVPVAPPELASKKVRRLVRKMVCKKCGGPPTVSGLRDDSVVRDYNLTLECTAQGNPAPKVQWYKDEVLITPTRNIKIRTRKRRRKTISQRGPGTRIPRQSPGPTLRTPTTPRRRRRLGRRRPTEGIEGGDGGRRRTPAEGTEGGRKEISSGTGGRRLLEAPYGTVGRGTLRGIRGEGLRGGAAAGTVGNKKRRLREGRGGSRSTDGERRRISLRRREEGVGNSGKEMKETEGSRRLVEGRRRRLEGASNGRRKGTSPGQQRSRNRGISRTTEASRNKNDSTNSNGNRKHTRRTNSSTSSSTSSRRRKQSNDRNSSSRTSSSSSSSPRSRRSKAITSTLMVRDVMEEDAGVYKCMAKSVAGEASSQARIRVVPPIDPHPFVDKCPIDGYCLNGGTCMMFKIVGELVCQCAEGFKGQRCQEKEVYPTFRRDCHGPLRHIRHSRGLRCPRNQPTALWELLQQALARGRKGSTLNKTHLTNWSPILTEHAYWPRFMDLTPHSSKEKQYTARPTGAQMVPKKHDPNIDSLSRDTSSSEVQHLSQATQDPIMLEQLIPNFNHSQTLKGKNQHDSYLMDSDFLVSHQQRQFGPRGNLHPFTTFKTPVKRKVKTEGSQNPKRNIVIDKSSAEPSSNREDVPVASTHYHKQRSHHKHHRKISTDSYEPSPHDMYEDMFISESSRSNDHTKSEAMLPFSMQMTTNAPLRIPITQKLDNLQH